MRSIRFLSEHGRLLPGAALILASSSLLIPCACSGDSEPDAEPREESAETPSTPATPTEASTPAPRKPSFDIPVELTGPLRVLNGHPTELPDWGNDLRDRIDPEGDDSWREKIAVRFEESGTGLVRALLEGDEATLASATTEAFEGLHGLFPDFGEARFDDGSFAVFDSPGVSGESESLAQLQERLRSSSWGSARALQVVLSVVGIVPDGEGRWTCDVELRIVDAESEQPTMLDIELDATLQESSEPGEQPQLVSMTAKHHRLIRRKASTFRSISGLILEDLPNWKREFGLGCVDYDRISDRRSIAFGTGMLGMALGDVNGDGRDDIYVSMLSGFPNRLLLNQADGSVVDGAPAAGVDILDTTRGSLLVDLDGDDDLDLCVTRQSDLILFWNDGKGGFSAPQLLDGPGEHPIYSISAADADVDGDLDIFCPRYRLGRGADNVPTPFHDARNGVVNLFWRNEGNREFTEVAEEVGLVSAEPRYSFIGLWEDFNEDGLIDLYVVNDFGPNNLFINTGDGFEDRAQAMGILDASTGMGISGADVELDGDLDYFITNIFSPPGLRAISEPEYRDGDEHMRKLHMALADGMSLYLQDAPGEFVESAAKAGADHGGWAWGAIFYDWNLDGYPDIYVPNGFISYQEEQDIETFFWRWVVGKTPSSGDSDEIYNRNWAANSAFNRMEGFAYHGHERNHLFLNLGEASFADISPISDADFIDDGRVAARLDWDNDGREDLVLVNSTAPRLRIVRNAHPVPGHRVVIELHGNSGSADAVSSRIKVQRSDGKVVTQTVYAGEGLLGQSSRRRFFGLGDSEGPVDVEVRWPDGEVQRFEDLAVDRGWKLFRAGGQTAEWAFQSSPFEDKDHAPSHPTPGGVHRALLADKMPMRYFTLQEAGGRTISMESLPPVPRLLTLWDPASRSGLAFLRQLAESHQQILASGTIVCPIAVGEAPAEGLPVLETLGLSEYALSAAKNDEMILEALLVEILGTFDDIPFPLTLLLDSQSRLCALYYGSIPTEELLDDLQRMKHMSADDDSTVALSDGYWLSRPKRRYHQIKRALMMLGARDLASDLKMKKD